MYGVWLAHFSFFIAHLFNFQIPDERLSIVCVSISKKPPFELVGGSKKAGFSFDRMQNQCSAAWYTCMVFADSLMETVDLDRV